MSIRTSLAFAIPCDCEVLAYAPLTTTHHLGVTALKRYELDELGTYAVKNQWKCRKTCEETFYQDMPQARLTALLLIHSEKLIENGVLGYNCTGLTTVKYPVRVKATLGDRGLGNVADFIHVITHEQACF